MYSINNIYKSNLDIIINWSGGDLVKQNEEFGENQNYVLEIDGCYFNYFKVIVPDFKTIINIYYKSFNHFLILISISSNIKNIDDNYNELNNEEYISNIINYLEQSLEGLYRFKEYYKNTLEYEQINKLYDNCNSQLYLIKNKQIIHSFYEINRLKNEDVKIYNNENDIFTEIEYEDIDFKNNNNYIIILNYISNILIRITNIVYIYTGYDITFGN
jgi:hypothetical protein